MGRIYFKLSEVDSVDSQSSQTEFRYTGGKRFHNIEIQYLLAKVIGLDISPTQIIPKNFEFIKANVQERLPFDDNTFDFVFQRFLLVGYAKEKLPYVINEIVRVLKPGGFLEVY
ncbi:S-adenosyl-L-methionine-dependent methyltransferase [Gigaspora margarita]|uniref:S-adenosyl-L-methionine-dependent methyltransferase n=1 Tax=Gigaspora margarita TaxID=4874 RepID=A0A8H3XPF3_GIGMA|nr:S-adenosyl-L-methionine-dependent methyltransferase [Gigaspora margarita]